MSESQSETVQPITELVIEPVTPEPRARWYQDPRTWKIAGVASAATAGILLVRKALSSDEESEDQSETTEYVFLDVPSDES